MIRLFIFLTVLLVWVNAGSDVIDLDEKTFKKQVLESNLPFMVEFFAPWCGHCKQLAPEWEKAATNLKGIVPLGKVDCTVHQNLCGQYQVQGYPTIKVFSDKGKKVTDYKEARQANAIVRAATDLLPNNVNNIKDTTSLSNFLSQSPEIPHLILFTAKKEISPLMKSLSLNYKGRVAFAQVKQDVAEVVTKYGIESFPKIITIKGDEHPITYDGAITPEELSNFVASFASDTEASPSTPPPPPPRARPPKSATDVSFVEITPENIDSTCRGLCIIGFVDVETSEDKRTVKEEQKQILDQVLASFKSDGKFQFGWVDISSQGDFVKKFSLESNTPSLIVYNAKRNRYVKAINFDHKSCFTTIEHVLTGDAQYTQL